MCLASDGDDYDGGGIWAFAAMDGRGVESGEMNEQNEEEKQQRQQWS